MNPALDAHIRESLAKAQELSEDYGPEQRGVVTRWVIIMEIAEPDGTRSLWNLCDDQMQTWEVQGILADTLAREQHDSNKAWEDGSE